VVHMELHVPHRMALEDLMGIILIQHLNRHHPPPQFSQAPVVHLKYY
jgi:hypothetical protein